jgi:hypothetical protein
MFSETVQGQAGSNPDLRGFSWWGYGAGFETYLPPNSDEPDVMQSSYYCAADNPRNPPCVGPHSADRPMTMAARSRHESGVHVALCDASVRFTSENVDLILWRALSTTEGSEPISGDF